jgi:alkylhydroperoxidase family enzyme
VGVTDEQIAALDNGDTSARCYTDEQKAAFAFSDEVVDLIEVTDRTYQTAKQHFSDRVLTEILYVVGTYMFVSRLIRTGHVPLDDEPAPSPVNNVCSGSRPARAGSTDNLPRRRSA